MAANVDKYDVKLTDEEKKAIEKVAEEFEKANSKDAKKKASATKEYAMEYLELALIKNKMNNAISDDIDKKVDEKEVAQKKMNYLYLATQETNESGATTKLSDDEVKQLKKKAGQMLSAAKQAGNLQSFGEEEDFKVETLTFDGSSTALDSKVIKEADALEVGDFSGFIGAADGFYIVRLVSTYDADATNEKIKEVLAERGSERYNELMAEWIKEVKVKVNDDVWKNMSLHALKISSDFAEATAQ